MRVHVLRRLIKRAGSVNSSKPALVTELSVRSAVLPSVQKDRRQFASRRIGALERGWHTLRCLNAFGVPDVDL